MQSLLKDYLTIRRIQPNAAITMMTPKMAAPMVPTSATASVMPVVTEAGTAANAAKGVKAEAPTTVTAYLCDLFMLKTPILNGAGLHPIRPTMERIG